eukprot:XP_011444417.2 PREDICTED: uncharacterized protein LOC105340183 isoform X1 [Crassostrea gigas]
MERCIHILHVVLIKCHLTITCCFQQTPFNMLNILYYVCDTRMNFYIFLKCCNVCGMDDSASNTLRSLLGKMEPPPMSSAEAYPTFLYKISPVLSVQQSPSMVQSSPSSKQTITSIMSSNMSSNITSASNSLALEEMGLRRTRTVIPNSVKVQIAKVANQIPRMTQGEIAQMFGIDRTTVSKILKRRREYLGPDSESPPRAKYNCCKFPPLN